MQDGSQICCNPQQEQKHQQHQQVDVGQSQCKQRGYRDAIEATKRYTLDVVLHLIKGLIGLYDLITLPIFYLKDNVRGRSERAKQVRSLKFDASDPNSAWRQVNILEPWQAELERAVDSFETYDKLMASAFQRNGTGRCYGYRQVVEEELVERPGQGRSLRQVKLTNFRWVNYNQFQAQIEAARKGFLLNGVRAGDKVVLFADTRPEWQIVSQALVRLGAVLATIYSTMGLDGIVHTVNETKVSLVVTQRDKVSRLLELKNRLPLLTMIVYFECSLHLPDQLVGEEDNVQHPEQSKQVQALRLRHRQEDRVKFNRPDVECQCFSDLLAGDLNVTQQKLSELETFNKFYNSKHTATHMEAFVRRKDSTAVIMYTSGSTGVPKGVLITHRNIMAAIKCLSLVTKDFLYTPKENLFIAYLPLAHIFEFCYESLMLYHGVPYGFGSALTLTDRSPGLQLGQRGDLATLRPTVMIMVPLVFDRVVQAVRQSLATGPYLKRELISYLIDYKARWQSRHYETPLVDRFVCNKIGQALGGRVRGIFCGSAPLSSATQTFGRVAFNAKVVQGYGATETCATTSAQVFEDQSTGNVGVPMAGARVKLEPWLDGNYTPDDRPNPRGEIVVGGEMIAQGYYKLDDQTREAFYVDGAGVRWFRTGDIGEMLPGGQLKIIDRKKDLVKLQNGEYISLGRVESALKLNPYLDHFCVYVNSNYNHVVALGPVNEMAIKSLAQQLVEGAGSVRQSSDHLTEQESRPLMSDEERQACMEDLRLILAESDEETVQKLCSNRLINESVLNHLHRTAKGANLTRLEVPRKLLLVAEEWTEDRNLVTAALKIRRNFVYKRYENDLRSLYES